MISRNNYKREHPAIFQAIWNKLKCVKNSN